MSSDLNDKSYDALEDQLRECYGRVIYSHKTHEKMADIYSDRLSKFKNSQIALNALTSSGAVGVVVFDDFYLKILTAFLAFVSLFVSSYLKSFDLGGLAQVHRDAAAKLWHIRESYLSLITDMRRNSISEIVEKRDTLQEVLATVYAGVPQTNSVAYKKARSGLKNNEEFTFDPKEIDWFLPVSLRKVLK